MNKIKIETTKKEGFKQKSKEKNSVSLSITSQLIDQALELLKSTKLFTPSIFMTHLKLSEKEAKRLWDFMLVSGYIQEFRNKNEDATFCDFKCKYCPLSKSCTLSRSSPKGSKESFQTYYKLRGEKGKSNK